MNAEITKRDVIVGYYLYVAGILIYNRFLNNYYFIMADQKRYVVSAICGLVDFFALFFEVFALRITKNYYLFLLIIAAKNALESILIVFYKKYKYTFLSEFSENVLDLASKSKIRHDIGDMIISKIGTLLLYNTDSIIISAIVNTAVSGCYSSYYFIAYGLQFVVLTVFETLIPKIAQYGISNGKNAQFVFYIKVSLANIVVMSVCISGFYWLAENFITLWMGRTVLLDHRLILIMSVNIFIQMCRYTSTVFRQAEGLFRRVSWIILFRGFLNIIISILFGLRWGLLGIVAATSVSDLLTVFWYEPRLVLKFYEKKFTFELVYQFLSIFAVVSLIFVCGKTISIVSTSGWLAFIFKGLIIVLVGGGISSVIAFTVFIMYSKFCMRDEPVDASLPPFNTSKHLVSFIIPAYNAENTIKRAAESVLSQSEIALELILVDDGSTDNTSVICEEIKAKDSRVYVYHTENNGQSVARNIGIHASNGDYIAFVDADDVLSWNGMKEMICHINEYQWDVVCGNYYCVIDGIKYIGIHEQISGQVTKLKGNDYLYQSIKTTSAFGYVWNKLYRKKFLLENELSFDDVRKVYMEDQLFNLKLFSCNPSYYFSGLPMYEYIKREESTCRVPDPLIAEKNCTMLSCYMQYLKNSFKIEENLDLLIPLVMRVFCWSVFRNIRYENIDSRYVLNRVKIFLNNDDFCYSIDNYSNIKYLNLVPKVERRIVYKFCFTLLHFRLNWLLSAVFIMGYPLMYLYVKKQSTL